MIIDKEENKLFKRLTKNRTAWQEKNSITCAKCYYCSRSDSYPTCDYAAREHKAKRCTGLTCIQRGIFRPANEKVKLEKVKKRYARWLKEQFARDPALEEMWELLNDGKHGFDRDPELPGGGNVQRDAGLHEKGLQTNEVQGKTGYMMERPEWFGGNIGIKDG